MGSWGKFPIFHSISLLVFLFPLGRLASPAKFFFLLWGLFITLASKPFHLHNSNHLYLRFSPMTFPFFSPLPFSLSYSEIGFTMNSSFTTNSLPIIKVHSPFQHFVCVNSWAVTTLRDTYQNFQIPQSLLDQSFKYCWDKPPRHTCAFLL